MLHRRPTSIAAPLIGVALAASLSACGFHYPTDRVNTISAGENNRTSTVDALGIRILASAPGEGRLIGALSNELDTPAALTKVGDAGGSITVGAFKPIKLTGTGRYNLSTGVANPIQISGDFQPGQVLMGLEMTFERNGTEDTIELNVPVVKPCHEYTSVPTPSQSATSGATGSATAPSTTTASATAATTGDANAFSCSDPSPTEAPAE